MIRLSRLTDYAVSLLTRMADSNDRLPETVWAAPDLAERGGLSLPTVSKILKHMAKAGIVEARRGSMGGYRLARSPASISIAAIVEAMDGPIALTDCAEGHIGGCKVESLCPMNGSWTKINTAVKQALESVTLADMTGLAHVPLPPTAVLQEASL